MVHGMGLCDDTDRFRVGMALKEALANALYRGNLGISYDQTREASEVLIVGGELDIVRERLALPEYSERRIYVHVRLDQEQAVFVIRDDGQGFDTSKLPAKGDWSTLDADTGRGIVLMYAFLDQVAFNDTGNEVTLIKRRR
jgi:hypothetical protein